MYIVPSTWVKEYCAPWVDTVKWVRFHVSPEDMEPFKNNWEQLAKALSSEDLQAVAAEVSE